MEVISHEVSNSSFYMMSAPTSPSRSSSLSSMYFYSAPTSPIRSIGFGNASFGYEFDGGTVQTNEDVNSSFDDFEFATSKKFRLQSLEFEKSHNFEYLLDDHQHQHQQQQGTLPTMAFADELFSNGQVLPLKLPPRLQCSNGVSQKSSTASSPRSPSSALKIQFPRRSMWNDKFDPFAVALEKVKYEKRRTSHHRRARSLSPLRTATPQHQNIKWDQQHQNKQWGGPLEPMQQLESGRNRNEIMASKGSAYARWFRRESKQIGEPKKSSQVVLVSPKGPPKHKGLGFGRRVRPGKTVGHEGTIKPVSSTLPGGAKNVESKRQKVKGLIRKYASFGRGKNDVKLREQIAALWKRSYFRRLSFRFKENGDPSNGTNGKVYGQPKMELTQYRPRPSSFGTTEQ